MTSSSCSYTEHNVRVSGLIVLEKNFFATETIVIHCYAEASDVILISTIY